MLIQKQYNKLTLLEIRSRSRYNYAFHYGRSEKKTILDFLQEIVEVL